MGLLIDGKWVDKWYDTKKSEGKFQRQESRFRHTVSNEPDRKYRPEANRYHLYVSLACPWAHRTLIFRQLKGLEDIISVSTVKAEMLENGWEFGDDDSPYTDELYHHQFMYELYLRSAPDYEGRVTVPVLWDKHTQTIVNNESADIIRIFNSAFNDITDNRDDYYQEALQKDIDEINNRVYHTINNGVYKAGFATTQDAYEQAFDELFNSLDWLERHLAKHRYLLGNTLTEADWRLFTTLIRFDAVYFGHFKCNRNTLSEFEHISHYLRELYQFKKVRNTVNLAYTKQHYYGSHNTINPSLVVPRGPELSFSHAHNRARLFSGENQ
jgi:putative glutathione S-transferase